MKDYGEIMKTLEEGVSALVRSENWKRYLDVQARFHEYSFGNCMLIAQQFPSATKVAGYKTWQKMGRQVKKGEHGIKILAPCPYTKTEIDRETGEEKTISYVFFKVVTVFDISQTEGAELPSPCRTLTGSDWYDIWARLAAFARTQDIEVEVIKPWPYEEGMNGFYAPNSRSIGINGEKDINQQAKTLAHELAHALDTQNKDQAARELIAESVAYIVMKAHGYDSGEYSFGYLAVWTDGQAEKIKAVGEAIQKVAEQILQGMQGKEKVA